MTMKVKKSVAVALFEGLGYANAETMSKQQMLRKFKKLPEVLEEEATVKDKDANALLKKIKKDSSVCESVEIEDDSEEKESKKGSKKKADKAKPKKGKAKKAAAEEEEEDEEDESEDDENEESDDEENEESDDEEEDESEDDENEDEESEDDENEESDDEEEDEESDDEEKEDEDEKPSKKKKGKKGGKAEKKPAKKKKSTVKRDKFGFLEESGASTIAAAVPPKDKKPRSARSIAEKAGIENIGRVRSHLTFMVGKKFAKKVDDGYVLTGKTA
jgi:hypothetical protein